MSVISARRALLNAMNMGVHPTIPALEDFIEEVNDFLLLVNDYDEWDTAQEGWVYGDGDEPPVRDDQPAITVNKLRKMLGYSEGGEG